MYPLWLDSSQLIVEPTADELHAIYDRCITYFKLGFDIIADIAYTRSGYDYCRQAARERCLIRSWVDGRDRLCR